MNWDSISIEQGQAIIAAAELPAYEREMRILCILYKKPVEYFEAKSERVLKGFLKKTEWINELPKGKYTRPFQKGNYVYKFKVLPSQLSHSEFTMLQAYGQSGVADLHKIMAVLSNKYRIFPKKTLDNTDHEARAEMFKKHMSFGLAYAYMLFFSTYYPYSLKIGLAYSQGAAEKAQEVIDKIQSSHG